MRPCGGFWAKYRSHKEQELKIFLKCSIMRHFKKKLSDKFFLLLQLARFHKSTQRKNNGNKHQRDS